MQSLSGGSESHFAISRRIFENMNLYIYAEGFPPVYDEKSRVLILGSFPSVKSREIGFYYGNRQNRFWKTVCGYFGEEVPQSVEEKKAFLLRRNVALWDVITSCEVVGSSDASIRNETVADIPALLQNTRIKKIFCNGTKSFSLLSDKFPNLLDMTVRLPSTSPANPRFSKEVWVGELSRIFGE